MLFRSLNIMQNRPDNRIYAVKDIVPKSDIDLAEDIVQNNGNGVLKYYAK